MVVRHLAKVEARVRFSYPAPFFEFCSARRIASLASCFSFGKISLLVVLPFFHNFADGRCVFPKCLSFRAELFLFFWRGSDRCVVG